MSISSENDQKYPDELTLKELIVSTALVISWLKTHVIQIFLICGLFAIIGGGWAYVQQEKFVAELSFMLSDDNNPQVSGISSMFGQLGLPLSTGKYNVDKLLEISKRRFLVEKTLLSDYTIENKEDFFANHFIEELELSKGWADRDIKFDSFRFSTNNPSEYSPEEQYAMKALVNLIVGNKNNRENALFKTDYGKTDYIMSFSLESPSPELSIGFVNHHYNNVSQYYIGRSIAKNQDIYNLIVQDRDSLLTLIDQNALEIARLRDKNIGSFRNTNDVKIILLESKLKTLQSAAEEVIKNLGRAQYVLDTRSPLIQLLDKPSAPLFPQKPSTLKYAILGGCFGFLFFLAFLFLINVVKELK